MNKRKKFFCEKVRNQGLYIDKYIRGGVNFLVRTISGMRYEITDSQCRGEKP